MSPHIQLVVLADNGLQTAHCRVSIDLLDVNDNAPVFEHSSYRTAVWEGQAHNTYIMQVGCRNASAVNLRSANCMFWVFLFTSAAIKILPLTLPVLSGRCSLQMLTAGLTAILSTPLCQVTRMKLSSWTLSVGFLPRMSC